VLATHVPWVGKCCRAASSLSTLYRASRWIGRDRCGRTRLGTAWNSCANSGILPRRFSARVGTAWTDTRFSQLQEAIIGVFFVLCATGGLILLANNPHGGESQGLSVGQILW